MGFGNKDLMMKLLPQFKELAEQIGEACALRTMICRSPTVCQSPTNIQAHVFCGVSVMTGQPTTMLIDPIVILDMADLESARRELSETITQLDRLERERLPSEIKTRAQADEAEELILKQLDVVRKAKEGLG